MTTFSNLVIRFRKPIIWTTIIVTIILGFFIKNIRINPDVTSYLPKKDPMAQLFSYIGDNYGGNQLILVALKTDDVFNLETIRTINDLTNKFKSLDGISYVTSLTNVLDFKKTGDGIEIGKLIDEYDLPSTPEELARLKAYAMSKDLYRGRLVSEDGGTALIVCRIRSDVDKIKISNQINTLVNRAGIREKVFFGGYPFLIRDMSQIILRDLKFLLPVVVLMIILALFFSFRSWRGVAIPIVSVLISIIWTIGIMCLFRIPLSIISNIIPVILVAVGSAYAIHVVSKFNEDNVSGPDRLERAGHALRDVVIPVFLAAATTMAGFISFIFGAYLTMIGEFGIFSALGVLFAFLISVTFVPAVLSNLGAKKIRTDIKGTERRSRFMEKLGAWVVKYRKGVLIAGFVLLILSGLGIPAIKRQVEIIDYFRPGTPTRLGEQAMERYFGGSTPLQILVRGDIADPTTLREMKKMEDFLKTLPNVHHPQSVADLIEEMGDLMGEGKTIPDSRAKVANLWFLLEGEDIMSQLVNGDKTEAVIQATLGKNSVHEVQGMIGKIDDYIRKNNTDSLSFSQTGMHYIHLKLDRAIVFNQTQSMILAMVMIFIMVALMLRSFFGGLIGLLPITFSLVLVFGIMGFARIPLDIATMLLGGIAIGTGIDYAIHFSSRFRHELRTGKDPRAAVITTMGTTGRAIMINVLTVVMGFLVLALGQLVPLQRFGLLIAITTASAGLGSITILPAVMLTTGIGLKIAKINPVRESRSLRGKNDDKIKSSSGLSGNSNRKNC